MLAIVLVILIVILVLILILIILAVLFLVLILVVHVEFLRSRHFAGFRYHSLPIISGFILVSE